MRDDEAQLTERLGFHLRTHDVLILSGGVSMGKLDLVPKVLEKLGVSLVFHHIAQRPGKPMWFGVSQSGPAVFALPGNPVSTLVCLARYVLPALRAAMGQAPTRSAAHRADRAGRGQGAAGVLPAGEAQERRLGPHLGRTLPDQRLRRFHRARRHRRLRRAAAGTQHVSEGFRGALLPLVSRMTMDPRENIVPLAARQRRGRRVDTLRRPIHDLRISVMDRCNFRCPYCMPRETFHESYRFLKISERLDFAEILRLARVFVRAGVKKLRITGGEPLLRPNLADLIGDLTQLPGIEDIALTTNGMLLAKYATELKAAGLRRITVSLDTLDPEVFAKMSGGFGGVAEVLDGIEHARRAGLAPIKINTVVQRGVNDHTVLDLLAHFRGTGVIVRFIEYMDVGTRNHWNPALVVPSRELAARIHARWPIAPRDRELPRRSRRALRLRRRRRRNRLHLLGVAAVLRRLLARAHLLRRLVLHLPVRDPGHGPARAAARRRHRRRALRALRGVWSGRRDRYSELRASLRDAAELHKVEMNYIGG